MRAGGSGGDGRGWGLEVVVSLKMVNPGGKGEFSGRQAFERMLYSGNGQASGSVLVATSPLRSNTVTNATANAPSPSMSFRPPPHTSDHRIPGSTPPVHNAGQGQGQQAPSPRAPANSTSARPPLPPARSSGSTLPPSSMPMAPSSSQSGTSRPPSTSGTARQPYRPPPAPHPPSSSASNSSAPARGQSNHPPQPPPSNVSKQNQNHPSSSASNHSTPNGKYQQPIPGPPPGSRHSRQVTPPPLPRPKSPPPTTPHRRALRDLLQADGKMSPSLAKELVNNPSLMALLKSIPSAARSPSGSGGEGSKRVKAEDSRSTRDETPTPTGPKTLPATAGKDGCSNCGTTETTMWRSKVYPDGTQTKVCDGESDVPFSAVSVAYHSSTRWMLTLGRLWGLLQQEQTHATKRIVGFSDDWRTVQTSQINICQPHPSARSGGCPPESPSHPKCRLPRIPQRQLQGRTIQRAPGPVPVDVGS